MDDQRLIERAPSALWREALDGVLVLTPHRPEPDHISTPGEILWSLLASPSTIDDLVTDLAGRFDIDGDVIRADVEPVLAALLEHGAVRPVEPPVS